MSAILFLIFVGIWAFVVLLLIWLVGKILPKAGWATLVRMLLFFGLLPLPIVDELVGKGQFEEACREYAVLIVDREKAAGKTVYLSTQPAFDIEGSWIRIVVTPWRFVDLTTGKTIVSYHTLVAGKKFIRLSEGGMPLTFRGTCAPASKPATVQAFKEYGINYVEPPVGKGGR